MYLIHNGSRAHNTAYITACFVQTRVFNDTENYFLMIRRRKKKKSARCFMLSDFIRLLHTGKGSVWLFFCDYHPSSSYPWALLHCKTVTRTVMT